MPDKEEVFVSLIYSYAADLLIDMGNRQIETILANHQLLRKEAMKAGCPVSDWDARMYEIIGSFLSVQTEIEKAMETQIITAITQSGGLEPYLAIEHIWKKTIVDVKAEFVNEMRKNDPNFGK